MESNTVYVVLNSTDYEENNILGVFSTVEKAMEYIGNLEIYTYSTDSAQHNVTKVKDWPKLHWREYDGYLLLDLTNPRELVNTRYIIEKHTIDNIYGQ